MKKFYKVIFLLFFLIGADFLAAQENGGWKNLFDGKSLEGWEMVGGKGKFYIDKKMKAIVGEYFPSSKNTFLHTKENYFDFILEFEVKLTHQNLNSGVQFRSYVKDKQRLVGYQLEIDGTKRRFTGGIYEEGLRRHINPLTKKAHENAKKSFKVGKWNKIRLEASGDTINTWVNGFHAASINDDKRNFYDHLEQNCIALQIHSITKKDLPKKNKVYFRNLRIKTEFNESDFFKRHKDIPQYNFIPNTLTFKEKEQGWTLFWNGKDFDQWQHYDGKNFIENEKQWEIKTISEKKSYNILMLDPEKNQSNTIKKRANLIKKNPYRYFEFSFAFSSIKPSFNSGVKYFYQPEKNLGYEYQICLPMNHRQARKLAHKVSALYDIFGPRNLSLTRDKWDFPINYYVLPPVKMWNYGAIVSRSNGTIEHWLNGFKMVSFKRESKKFKEAFNLSKFKTHKNMISWQKGYILLQHHGDPIIYHSLKIRKLEE